MKDYSELYDWFLKDIIKPAVIRNGDRVDTFVRLPYDDDFDYIYHQDNYNGQALTPTRLEYCGIYNKLDGQIYDAQFSLRGKLPTIDSGKSIMNLFDDFDKEVRSYIEGIVGDDIGNLRSPFFGDEHFTVHLEDFKKFFADGMARVMFLDKESSEDLHYECDFTTDTTDSTLMLKYLRHPTASVEQAATDYWMNHQDDILLELRKNEVLREKLNRIYAEKNNPLHKQRAIIEAVRESGAKTVNVTIIKGGEECRFKYSAEQLCQVYRNDYDTWDMSPKDRHEFENRFGRWSSFTPEDISEISYRGKTLHDSSTFMPETPEDDDFENVESEDDDEGFTMSM